MTKYSNQLGKEEQVKTIIDNFDFEKVQKTMKALKWTWYDSDETPSYGRLVNTATDLLLSAYSEAVRSYGMQTTTLATGGFCVTTRRFESDIYLELTFQVTSTDMRDLAG